MSGIKKRVIDLEHRRAKQYEPMKIVWTEIGKENEVEPPEPGELVIYWDTDGEIGSYRYDPNKPNGGKPDKKGGK